MARYVGHALCSSMHWRQTQRTVEIQALRGRCRSRFRLHRAQKSPCLVLGRERADPLAPGPGPGSGIGPLTSAGDSAPRPRRTYDLRALNGTLPMPPAYGGAILHTVAPNGPVNPKWFVGEKLYFRPAKF